ncbi:MAG: hypothetical protein K0U68_00505 [Gammaproteobacteria bacterium]|nr:hypothetical protein [Gammaproteobacteria bacterium]
MNNAAHNPDTERLIALIGLAAAKQNSHPGPCPSDEKMAELIDNSLDHKQRVTMLRHLNHCNSCYRLWVETTSMLLEEKDLIDVVNIDQYRATAS